MELEFVCVEADGACRAVVAELAATARVGELRAALGSAGPLYHGLEVWW